MDVHAAKPLSLKDMGKVQRLGRDTVHYKRLVVEMGCPDQMMLKVKK